MAQRNLAPETIAQLQRYNVNLDQWEAIKQSLYDYQTYALAGTTQQIFFAVPAGQGGKTKEDTNMTLAGQLPTNNLMLVESIEISFTSNTLPSIAGVDGVISSINDAYIFRRRGWLLFTIGQKDYLTEGALMRFPEKAYFETSAAVSQAGEVADAAQRVGYATARGRPYLLNPPLLLIENQNFQVALNWPTAQPITADARVGVILDGQFYRRAQ